MFPFILGTFMFSKGKILSANLPNPTEDFEGIGSSGIVGTSHHSDSESEIEDDVRVKVL